MKKFLLAACMVAFFLSFAAAGPVARYQSKVPVMRGKTADIAGKRYWVWEFGGRRYVNRLVAGKMVRFYL